MNNILYLLKKSMSVFVWVAATGSDRECVETVFPHIPAYHYYFNVYIVY